jgi:hypothetical protein
VIDHDDVGLVGPEPRRPPEALVVKRALHARAAVTVGRDVCLQFPRHLAGVALDFGQPVRAILITDPLDKRLEGCRRFWRLETLTEHVVFQGRHVALARIVGQPLEDRVAEADPMDFLEDGQQRRQILVP